MSPLAWNRPSDLTGPAAFDSEAERCVIITR